MQNTKYYAAYQAGYAVFGTGSSKEEAYKEALGFAEYSANLEDFQLCIGNGSDMIIAECTGELHSTVQLSGGDISVYENADGLLDVCHD